MSSAQGWMRDMHERMRKATTDVNIALQPRVVMAKRSIEESMQSIGLRQGPEIYHDDEQLLVAVVALDDLRELLKSLSTTVEAHRKNLLAAAATERALGEIMSVPSSNVSELMQQHLSSPRVEAQVALGTAQVSASSSMSRFALDMSTPMADLIRTFEETYTSKITPLKKLYASQKAEHAKYARQAAACEDDVRRANLESIAESAKPVWERTSETLRAEIQRLAAFATSNMSEWLLNVAQAEAEMYTRSAKAFEAPARQAEASQQD